MNEEQKGEVIRRGEMAEELLKNEVFGAALTWIDAEALRMVRESKDPDEAYRAAVLSQTAVRFRAVLVAYVQNGESMAASILREQVSLDTQREHELQRRRYLENAEQARREWEEQNDGK